MDNHSCARVDAHHGWYSTLIGEGLSVLQGHVHVGLPHHLGGPNRRGTGGPLLRSLSRPGGGDGCLGRSLARSHLMRVGRSFSMLFFLLSSWDTCRPDIDSDVEEVFDYGLDSDLLAVGPIPGRFRAIRTPLSKTPFFLASPSPNSRNGNV